MDKDVSERIASLVVPNAGQKFRGDDLRLLRGPGVYVCIENGKALYVGSSKRLLGRIGGVHLRGNIIDTCWEVLLYPCVSLVAARQLEAILIKDMSPPSNQRGKFNSAHRQTLEQRRASIHTALRQVFC
jgi:hypothetical protein